MESFWFNVSTKERVIRVLLANAWVGFGWVAGLVRTHYQASLDSVGIRAFYANCFIVFLLYFVPLNLMPVYIFTKLHNSDNTELNGDGIRTNRTTDMHEFSSA